MKMSKVGNQTNSQDPQAVNSRVFVGNLNTFQCSKTDVERMFQRYGRLAGISMHKGFAFIQFTNPFDARSACLGEDGRTVLGQTLDVNLVCEPKVHQTGRKRQNLSKTGNDWDYFYDSAFPSLEFSSAASSNTATPSMAKRARIMITAPSRQQLAAAASILPIKTCRKQQTSPTLLHKNNQHKHLPPTPTCPQQHQYKQHQSSTQYQTSSSQQHQEDQTIIISQLKTYSNPDILICGNCREMFEEISEMIQHKKNYCKLRFACKCINTTYNGTFGNDKISLICAQCKESFHRAWDLLVHVQATHMVNVYELGTTTSSTLSSPTKNNNSHDYNSFLENNESHSEGEKTDHEESGEETNISEKINSDMIKSKFQNNNNTVINNEQEQRNVFSQMNGSF